MMGLGHTSASQASLLLNLEAVLTAVLAWVVFHENADRRIVVGMMFIVAAGLLLALPQRVPAVRSVLCHLPVAPASLCWALDNNRTHQVTASDAVLLPEIKRQQSDITTLTLELGTA